MAKKTRPSFDAPKKPAGPAAGWVYRSDRDEQPAPVASHPSPVVSRDVAVVGQPTSVERCVLAPLAIVLMTALAPVSWLRGKS